MNLRNKSSADIESLSVMPDGSGAPAVIRVGRYRFALDRLGQRVSCHGLNATGSAREQVRAASAARAAYVDALARNTNGAWVAANNSMYADVPAGTWVA
jgi:hypothetical protein